MDIIENSWNQLVEYIEHWSKRLPDLKIEQNLLGKLSPVGSLTYNNQMLEKWFFLRKQNVILVDENDNELGVKEKLAAHRDSNLHRAFSIFVFNTKGELLLQQRALNKYHSGGLWSNTCCSHPLPTETTDDAAHRKLKQEMGFDCPLRKVFAFTYRVDFPNGLTEYEYDHVLIGEYDGPIKPAKKEVSSYRWVGLDELRKEIESNPDSFTYWFKVSFEKAFAESNSR